MCIFSKSTQHLWIEFTLLWSPLFFFFSVHLCGINNQLSGVYIKLHFIILSLLFIFFKLYLLLWVIWCSWWKCEPKFQFQRSISEYCYYLDKKRWGHRYTEWRFWKNTGGRCPSISKGERWWDSEDSDPPDSWTLDH